MRKLLIGFRPRTKYIKGGELKRFFAKVKKDNNGCWIWQAGLKDGYAAFRTKDMITVRGHKWFWEKINERKVKYGLELDHLCIKRACVNPKHLEEVTHAENLRRAPVGKRALRSILVTHCPQGHIYDEVNTYRPPGLNERHCRTCRRERSRAQYA